MRCSVMFLDAHGGLARWNALSTLGLMTTRPLAHQGSHRVPESNRPRARQRIRPSFPMTINGASTISWFVIFWPSRLGNGCSNRGPALNFPTTCKPMGVCDTGEFVAHLVPLFEAHQMHRPHTSSTGASTSSTRSDWAPGRSTTSDRRRASILAGRRPAPRRLERGG
jgi:hypothetical protein